MKCHGIYEIDATALPKSGIAGRSSLLDAIGPGGARTGEVREDHCKNSHGFTVDTSMLL